MKEVNIFIDTNIIIYSIDSRNERKQQLSAELIKRSLIAQNGFISHQVVQEFLNTASRKFTATFSAEELVEFSNRILFPLMKILPNRSLFMDTLEIQHRWKYSFYDSLIIAAALSANCKKLYSEDLQHGQKVHGLTILNPFKES